MSTYPESSAKYVQSKPESEKAKIITLLAMKLLEKKGCDGTNDMVLSFTPDQFADLALKYDGITTEYVERINKFNFNLHVRDNPQPRTAEIVQMQVLSRGDNLEA